MINLIKDFLRSEVKNTWLSNSDMEIYVRKSTRYLGVKKLVVLDLANIHVYQPSRGIFTDLIKELHVIENLYIENVLTERFANYLRRCGFNEITLFVPCFFLEKTDDLLL